MAFILNTSLGGPFAEGRCIPCARLQGAPEAPACTQPSSKASPLQMVGCLRNPQAAREHRRLFPAHHHPLTHPDNGRQGRQGTLGGGQQSCWCGKGVEQSTGHGTVGTTQGQGCGLNCSLGKPGFHLRGGGGGVDRAPWLAPPPPPPEGSIDESPKILLTDSRAPEVAQTQNLAKKMKWDVWNQRVEGVQKFSLAMYLVGGGGGLTIFNGQKSFGAFGARVHNH